MVIFLSLEKKQALKETTRELNGANLRPSMMPEMNFEKKKE
jgi:hypothetical protein